MSQAKKNPKDYVLFERRRLDELLLRIEEMAAGDWGKRCVVSGQRDEMDALSYAVNRLVEELAYTEKLKARGLREAKDQAEMANRQKTLFLANMSHEVRTPMNAIIGFAEILRSGRASADEATEFLDRIVANGQFLADIINDLLDLSRVEAGKIHLESKWISLGKTLEFVLSSIEQRFSSKKMAVMSTRVQVAKEVPDRIMVDAQRLIQILTNIIGNAYKFTPSGEVVVSITLAEAIGDRGLLKVVVKDSGIGIDEEFLPRLFDHFAQGDPQTSGKIRGTGLGLALAKRLAEAMGGDVVLVDSIKGAGSTFEIAVQVGLPGLDMQTETSSVEKKAKRLDGVKILLAEDSVDNQELFTFMLECEGALVDVAFDGQEALDLAAENTYEMILMDIRMPQMDGYEALREIRNLGLTVPVVALTAHAMYEDKNKFLEAGFNNYMIKPINRQDFIAMIVSSIE